MLRLLCMPHVLLACSLLQLLLLWVDGVAMLCMVYRLCIG